MRGRSRNNNNNNGGGGNKGPNPLTRSYESNGPDVKIRGTAQHVAEKYSQLARDAHSSGDPVAAENYYQHAEHYIRIIAAAHEVLREQYGYQPRSFEDEGDEEAFEQRQSNGDDGDPASQPQPFEPRQDGDRRPRFDRQDRGGQDRDRQDRGGQDRDRQDRDRQDRSSQDRGDRQNIGERQDRGDRQNAGERQDRDRQDRDRQDRGDRRDRFSRDRGPRPETQRDEQPRVDFDRVERTERVERPERSEPPVRAERPDRPERVERAPRGRPPRREPQREESDEAAGLPAFLTNPVRTVLASDIDEAPAPAPRAIATAEPEIRPRRRAVRRPPPDETGNSAEPNDGIGTEKAETPAE